MNRSSFLASASITIAASGVPGGSDFVERAANFDSAAFDRAVGKAAKIRQLWEAVAFHPAIFNNVKNGLNGLQFGFGYDPASIATVIAPHGPSSAYNYSDYVWQKYRIGEAFNLKDSAGATIAANTFLKSAATAGRGASPDDPNGFCQDTSIPVLQSRGVVFLTCHTAVEEQARTLVKGGFASGNPSDVADDILTHLIPGTIVVPAMIAAIGVLQQKYKYSYLTLTFA